MVLWLIPPNWLPIWGNSSGTGTSSGTFGLPNQPPCMWQGQWSPIVYGFSSNAKELATLLLTMGHAGSGDSTILFYFMDNQVMYFIAWSSTSANPHLYAMIENICLLGIKLGCQLWVVHVSRLVMIAQCTNELSCGMWCSTYHCLADQ